MKLRYRLVLIFVFIIFIYSSIGYLLIDYMILPKNELLCRSMAMKDVERCKNAKNEYLNHLMTLTKNYAAWDDTYFFMQHKNTNEYIDSNLNFTTFRDLDIDILMYYDDKGNLYWGNVLDIKDGKNFYDKVTLNRLDKVIKEKYPQLLSKEKPISGIIVGENNSFLIASHPIIRPSPDSKEPPMGVVIMGVWEDKEFQTQLIKNTLVNLELIPLNEENRQKYAANIEGLNKAGGLYFESISQNEDAVFIYALDINDKPSLLFKAIFDRQIYSSNYAMLKIFLRSFILISIASMILLIWILQKIVIMPVLKLTGNIIKIKNTKKYSIDIGTTRKDEIGILTNQFNEMQRTFKEYDENLEKLVQTKTNDIMKSQKDTIIRLAIASEKKDTDTGKHIERISKYSKLLAKKSGLLASECEMISWASVLHDIGKIGTPDNILKKPGKLTEEEYKIMKEHTEIGRKILEGSESELLKVAKDIALSHHEYWNGKGYPKGLVGDAIPLPARIVSIVDVFDALLSKRVYKEPFKVEDVIKFFKDNRGKNFDPLLTDLFLENINEFLEIRDGIKQ